MRAFVAVHMGKMGHTSTYTQILGNLGENMTEVAAAYTFQWHHQFIGRTT